MKKEKKVVNNVEYEVSFVESQSRWAGTGYRNLYYRVIGTDDAIMEKENVYCQENGQFYTQVYYKKNFFSERKAYGRKCKSFARYYDLPVEFVMAVSPDILQANMSRLANVLRYAGAHASDPELNWALSACGIARRKDAIAQILGDDLYESLNIDSMGQKNSKRVADFLLSL